MEERVTVFKLPKKKNVWIAKEKLLQLQTLWLFGSKTFLQTKMLRLGEKVYLPEHTF